MNCIVTKRAVGADSVPVVADARECPRDLWRHAASVQLVAVACHPHVLWRQHIRTTHRCAKMT